MEALNKSQRKKVINEGFKIFFKREKVSKYNIWDNGYNIKKDINGEDMYIGLMTFLTNSLEVSYGDFIHLKKVEDIIVNVQYPNFNFSDFINKKSYLRTIKLSYFKDQGIKEKLFRTGLDWTEEDCIIFANNVIEYFENKVSPFFNYYTYFPNILAEMDKLESEGNDWNDGKNGILMGGGAAFFRGLIIAKLCNDANFEEKKLYVENIFNTEPVFEKWLPYYEKLKLHLATLDPIYNI